MIVHLGNNKKPCFALESSVVLPLLCNDFDLDKLDFLCLLITWLLVALDPSQRLTGRRMGEAHGIYSSSAFIWVSFHWQCLLYGSRSYLEAPVSQLLLSGSSSKVPAVPWCSWLVVPRPGNITSCLCWLVLRVGTASCSS